MIKLILYILLILLIFFPIGIITGIIEHNNIKRDNTKSIESKKTDKDYWYNYPHYIVLPSGRKINLPEYLTYEQYKHMNENSLARFLSRLDFRLIEENNNNDVVL